MKVIHTFTAKIAGIGEFSTAITLIICTTDICTPPTTGITTNAFWRSTTQIRQNARKPPAAVHTVIATTKPCRTVTTLIIWLTVNCIIITAGIAIITARSRPRRLILQFKHSPKSEQKIFPFAFFRHNPASSGFDALLR